MFRSFRSFTPRSRWYSTSKYLRNRQSLRYEIPNPNTGPEIRLPPPRSSAFKKQIPILIGAGLTIWIVYSAKHLLYPSPSDNAALPSAEKFSPYVITYKYEYAPDHFLIELSPTMHLWRKMQQSKYYPWNGHRLWSIEIRQPDMQIARRYTPLPLMVLKSNYQNDSGKPPVLHILSENPHKSSSEEGRMLLVVKRYNDGEVSRWLCSLPPGTKIDIRGPHTEYEFQDLQQSDLSSRRPQISDTPSTLPPDPQTPQSADPHKNILFLSAGTGITPALQMLLSPNPPRGFVQLFHSASSPDVVPLNRFLFFLKSAGRISMSQFYDRRITEKDIIPPASAKSLPEQHRGALDKLKSAVTGFRGMKKETPVDIAFVCGPESYVRAVSGARQYVNIATTGNQDTPIKGYLGKKGWTSDNVVRLAS
ncbi:hypothetical protein CANCADRAFT_45718 [Tortispora caseinolytica NRRL Y-17796]|uniref:FAD-binding FR-type domain-containing protein n=1 Tax=Tortispora caseinolytica NRRL Y-17796 TaxID=767744 RepID=A0A1E4TBY7_9ASCO|nr:hypothetical protein CANCADRAFT_45718 [Tortispora caseinolytica NRRL Y-17796]